MAERKTPILLRRGPISGCVYAMHRYVRKVVGDTEIIDAGLHGKQDVSSDFDALVLMELLDGAPNGVPLLERCAQGFAVGSAGQVELTRLHRNLVAVVDRHNARHEALNA